MAGVRERCAREGCGHVNAAHLDSGGCIYGPVGGGDCQCPSFVAVVLPGGQPDRQDVEAAAPASAVVEALRFWVARADRFGAQLPPSRKYMAARGVLSDNYRIGRCLTALQDSALDVEPQRSSAGEGGSVLSPSGHPSGSTEPERETEPASQAIPSSVVGGSALREALERIVASEWNATELQGIARAALGVLGEPE